MTQSNINIWNTVQRSAGNDGIYKLLVEGVRDYAIFALDPTGHLVSWNMGAQRIKGYAASDIVGRHFSIFYPPAAIAAGIPDYELTVAESEGRFEDEGWRLRKDGTRFWANVIITALRDEGGDLVGFAKVTRDLTERKLSEEQAIADARRVTAAETANRTKGEFLTLLSHELRTPLNAIGGYADLLMMGVRGPINQEQRLDLERIRHSQRHLLGIINDLLNFSRMEAGLIHYAVEPVTLSAVLDAVIPMVLPQARTKGVTLERGECADAVGKADCGKVEQIVLNLLSNAVKFTDAGGRITVSCATAGTHVTLRVSDTGHGIAPDMLESIFEPFVQVGRTLRTAHEGTGLGLAISRDLACAMQGDLQVSSTVGQGSTFTLVLPVAA